MDGYYELSKEMRIKLLTFVVVGLIASINLHAASYLPLSKTYNGQLPAEFISAEASGIQATDGSVSVTVPSGTDTIVVVASGYRGTGNELIETLNFDNSGLDFTNIINQRWNGTNTGKTLYAAYIQEGDTGWPGTGAKTLYFGAANGIDEGIHYELVYLKNIDGTTPVVDSLSYDVYNDDRTINLTGVGSNDITFIIGRSYGVGPNVDPAASGQTAIIESSVENSDSISVGYEVGEGSPTIGIVSGSLYIGAAFSMKSQ